jgi:hypothetical protein
LEAFPDFVDLLREFNAAGVRYLVVGAHALAVHGRARATKDLDVWIDPEVENAKRAYAALGRFGAPLETLRLQDLSDPDTFFQIGVAPLRIDVLTAIDGVTFDEAWPERVESEYGGEPITVLGEEAFLRNKDAAGRPQDRADADWLRRARGKRSR